jgi:hypothetical protein
MTLERPAGFVPNLPNCGVTAIAVVTGQNYKTVWNWFAEHNGHSAKWKGRTRFVQLPVAMTKFGVKFKSAPIGMTVEGFANWHTIPDRTYLMCISGHIFVLRNGIITDNTSRHGKSVILYGRRKVKAAWEILK